MKIVVLNGSPKGDVSVTMQYVRYIQKFTEHELKILNISQRIRKIERNEGALQEILDEIRSADAVLWATPVYFFLVPAQYKRFIELLAERERETVFEDKYCAALTTSIHFYDHTAHNYLHAVSDDLNMRFLNSYSADMSDLRKEGGREKLLVFAQEFFDAIEKGYPTAKRYRPMSWRPFDYRPGTPEKRRDLKGKKLLIVTDAQEGDQNLLRMVERFKDSFNQEIPVVNLHELDIKGGCQGCLNCGYDNECSYQEVDEFVHFYEGQIKTADILVWAGTMKDRYLSARWKTFFDRSFYNGHAPSLTGKQVAFLISGPLSQNANLRQILAAYLEIQGANLAGIVSDEVGDSAEIDRLLDDLARRLLHYAAANYIKPVSFLGVGGKKLFRDEVWSRLRIVFQADHRTYKRLGAYDFPQKDLTTRMLNALVPLLLKVPGFRREFVKRIKPGMVQPYQKIIEGEN